MPFHARQPCRVPRCPYLADQRGYCLAHDPGPWAETTQMLRDWYRIRPVVLARDRHICQFCGQYATTVDHITPRSAGGTDELDNLRALCTPCHAKRSAAQGGIASGSVRGT